MPTRMPANPALLGFDPIRLTPRPDAGMVAFTTGTRITRSDSVIKLLIRRGNPADNHIITGKLWDNYISSV